jgi:outer membrane murein-binding lipoprotein Lpp
MGQVAVRAIEAAYGPRIQAAQARVEALEAQLGEDAVAVQAAKIELATSKERLEQIYSVAGLSSEEVATRLQGLKL